MMDKVIFLLGFIHFAVCEQCAFLYESETRRLERNTNLAYHKGTFSSAFECGKFCVNLGDCLGFNVYHENRATQCAFFKTFSQTSEMVANSKAQYFEKSCPGLHAVNSMQYYSDRKYLVLNGDTLVTGYHLTSFNKESGVIANLDVVMPLEDFYEGWKFVPDASLNLVSSDGNPTILFNGKKGECYQKSKANNAMKKCTNGVTYSLFDDVFAATNSNLQFATSDFTNSALIYGISKNISFYVKHDSSTRNMVTYKAAQKDQLRTQTSQNPWYGLPEGVTAVAMIDQTTAMVFVDKTYYLYDTTRGTYSIPRKMCEVTKGCKLRQEIRG